MPSTLPTENALGKAVNEFGIGTYDSDNGTSSRGEDDEDPKSENSSHNSLPGTQGTDPFGPDRLLSYPGTFSSSSEMLVDGHRIVTAEEYVEELVGRLKNSNLPGDQDSETTHRRPKTDNIDSVIPSVSKTQLPVGHEPSQRSDYYDHMKIGWTGDEWPDEDSGTYSSEEEDSLPGVEKNEVTVDNFLNSLGNYWSGTVTEDISGPSGFPSKDFSENTDYTRNDLQSVASEVDQLKIGFDSAIQILDSIHIAADNVYSYLVGLNLKQLQKTNKPNENEDARTFYGRLQELAKNGPLFSASTIQVIENYNVKIDKNTAKWLAIQIEDGLEPPSNEELSYVFDWIRDQEPDLDKLDFEEAKESSDGWHEGFKSKDHKAGPYKTKNIDLNLSDGYSMVLVPVEDLDTEGELMQHCVGSYKDQVEGGGTKIYSLRDSSNKPHVTIELDGDGNINRIQGKQNEPPIKKYHPYIWEWVEKRDLINEHTLEFAPASVLARMSEDSNIEVRRDVALNPNTPANALARLSEDSDSEIRYQVAQNHNTPASALARMSEDSDEVVRRGVALNPNTLTEVLVRLSEDPDEWVRHGVAGNRSTPASVLARMSEDPDEGVRRQVARNPKTPTSVLARMAEDEDEWVRQNVAHNPKTPAEARERAKRTASNLYPVNLGYDLKEMYRNDLQSGGRTILDMSMNKRLSTDIELVGNLSQDFLKKYGKKDLTRRHVTAFLSGLNKPQYLASDIIRCLKLRNSIIVKDVLDEFPVSKTASSVSLASVRDKMIELEINSLLYPEVSSVFRRCAARISDVIADVERFEARNG